ncbi:hypothetical protein HMI56_005888 [Coelomomyces lativittatus]|nr:hypothetical protein HMI56_005888 [Coelomomyces lativittatus]
MESLDPEVSTDPSWGSSPSSVHVSSPGHSKPTHSLPVDTPPPDHCTRSTKSIGTCIMEEVGKTESSHASKKTTNSLPLHSSDPPISGFYDYKHLKAQTVRRNKEYWNIEEVILRRLRYLVDHSCEMPDQLHSLLMTLENRYTYI